jgi:hypothetical protein
VDKDSNTPNPLKTKTTKKPPVSEPSPTDVFLKKGYTIISGQGWPIVFWQLGFLAMADRRWMVVVMGLILI